MKFEDKLTKLEKLVAGMESGAMSLDDMIKSFEEGRGLIEECNRDLESIRLKIEKVTASGAVEEVPHTEDGGVAP
jgi:exodeoxyribonuclease VII small subunit